VIDLISQNAFDELQNIMGVSVDENDYKRWVNNGCIRVVDVWDVLKDVQNITVIDWRAESEEIKECLNKILDANGANIKFKKKKIEFKELYNLIENFNKKAKEVEILLFGKDWWESDSVEIIALPKKSIAKIMANKELSGLFQKIGYYEHEN